MLLGIDTGGTFTDAVLFDDTTGTVVAKAKARTRHADLTIGIGEAVAQVISDPADVTLVSLSTTLATNALVEGIGARVGLIFIGFTPEDVNRGGLPLGLGDDPVIFAVGGHNSFGTELAPLDLEAIERQADAAGVTSFAVSAQFGVRNPEHEIAVSELLAAKGYSVTCGHHLTAKLNGPKRALTCVLNARLIGTISNLCSASETILHNAGIDAPLMLVRGDGSLVTAEFAKARPIETILSGPAASLIGARFLTGIQDAIVSDIGGTTTDIAILRNGEPSLSPEGAEIGGHRTMVEAIQMYTHGLGGDSEVSVNDRELPARLTLGPRRLVPISLLAMDEPELVHNHLSSRSYPPREADCRFFSRSGEPVPSNLPAREQALLDNLGEGWIGADKLISGHLQANAMRSLVRRGLVRTAGFTPSDAAHVLGIHSAWDAIAAAKAADFLAMTSDTRGQSVCADGKAFASWVIDTLVRTSAELLLNGAMSEDGLTGSSELALVQQALNGHVGATRLTIGLDLPLVGLGASAATYYPRVAATLGTPDIIPEHADVANAIGAVVGQVRIARSVTVDQPTKGQFRVYHPAFDHDFGSAERAHDHALEQLTLDATEEAQLAGAAEVTIRSTWDTTTAVIEDKEVFVEGTLSVIASGRPRAFGG